MHTDAHGLKGAATRLMIMLLLCVLETSPMAQFGSHAFGQEPRLRGVFVKKRPTAKPPNVLAAMRPDSVALGYTLFVADPAGRAIPNAPDRILFSGDRIRILIESNTDGYLYVFNQEGNRELRLLFPEPSIRRGSARITAHVPIELPGVRRGRGDSDWFILSGAASRERLIMVLSKTPVEGWPSGRALLSYPTGYSISRQELEEVTAEPFPEVEQSSNRERERSSGSKEDVSESRGPKVSQKELSSSVVVRSAPGAVRVVVHIRLR